MNWKGATFALSGLLINAFMTAPSLRAQGATPKYDCAPGLHLDPQTKACVIDGYQEATSPEVLPPPSGVIVLKPGGVREQAKSCPPEYREKKVKGNWRFCVDPLHPEPIPPLMIPPMAGIPYEEALQILERHRAELLALPGVYVVGMGEKGIYVETDDPAVLPKEIEGLPLQIEPHKGRRRANPMIIKRAEHPITGGDTTDTSSPPAAYMDR